MDSSLIYGICTLGAGVIALVVRYGFKSKCSDVSLCFGLIHIQRDIGQEIEEQKMETNHPSPNREMSLRNMNNV
jgi:hypothetical protein